MDTEIVDYTNEHYTLGLAQPRVSDLMLFSNSSRSLSSMGSGPLNSMPSSTPSSSEHSIPEFAQQYVSNPMPFSMSSRSLSSENSIPEMGLTNAFVSMTSDLGLQKTDFHAIQGSPSQPPRESFSRSLLQPMPTTWAMSGSMVRMSSVCSKCQIPTLGLLV